MISDSSSTSDSEISGDEDLDKNILKAFSAVKCSLKAAGLKNNEKTEIPQLFEKKRNQPKTESNKKTGSFRHKLIYQTFNEEERKKSKKKCSNDTDNENVIEDQESKQGENVIEDKASSLALGSSRFFLDKGPAVSAGSEIKQADDIVAYDLSNLGDSVDPNSDNQELIGVDTYDLTNIDELTPGSLNRDNIPNEKDAELEKNVAETASGENDSNKKKKKKKVDKG